MVKKDFIIAFFATLFFCKYSYAEGQAGVAEIINFANYLFNFGQILVYTFFGGMILRFLLNKFKPEIQNRNVIAFLTSFFLIILIIVIFENSYK